MALVATAGLMTPSLEDMKRKVPKTISTCFALIENEYFKGLWVSITALQCLSVYPCQLARGRPCGSIGPKVLDHRDRMHERPAKIRTLARELGQG